MRIHFLPAEQQKRNSQIVGRLRDAGLVLIVLCSITLAVFARIYNSPFSADTGATITNADGSAYSAVVVAPDYILSLASLSGEAEFVVGGERIPARAMSSVDLGSGASLTLFKLQAPTSAVVSLPTAVDIGSPLIALDAGNEWRGSVLSKSADGYELDPAFELTAGTAVQSTADKTALVGFGVKIGGRSILRAAKDVLDRFPELKAAR